MPKRFLTCIVAAFLIVSASSARAADKPAATATEHWEVQGDLTEACTCAVPCTCNFGEGASPHHYCYSVFSLDIQKGHYGAVKLDGLHLAAVHGKKSKVWYVDATASPEQAAALRAIADHIGQYQHTPTAAITQKVGDNGNELQIGDKGGFEADYIMGLDGKTPVVVDNNTTWNIPRSIKGKTKYMRYKDEFGNKLDFRGTNSNQGKFDWTDQTEHYF
jgi:hypothetical protein